MIVVDNLDRGQWRDFVDRHPNGCIFHTPEMFDVFCRTRRHHCTVLGALSDGGEILALLTSVQVQSLPHPLAKLASRTVWYGEPICRPTAQGERALAEIIREHDRRVGKHMLFSEIRLQEDPRPQQDVLESCGYIWEPHLNFLLDLGRPSNILWDHIGKSCRSNIRQAEKKGTTILEETSLAGVDQLYRALRVTFDHARVPLADKTLFQSACEVLAPLGMMKIFVARHEDRVLGAAALLLYKQTAYDWYCGNERIQGLYPAECTMWHRIQWSQQQGYTRFNFGGAGSPDKPYGVRDFKARFGGRLVNYGRYRKIYSSWKYQLAVRGYEAVRNVAFRSLPRPAKFSSIPATHVDRRATHATGL